MDQVFQKMEGGNAAIAAYYAGDYLSAPGVGHGVPVFRVIGQVAEPLVDLLKVGNAAVVQMADNAAEGVDLRYVVPEEGSNWFVDAMCVLKDAPHYDAAPSSST